MVSRRTFLKTALNSTALGVASACGREGFKPVTARHWHANGDEVICELCPHACLLMEGNTGKCRTRQNIRGTLVTHAYANPCAVHVDPIEKKPLYHVLPGAGSFSIAVAGCNLRCLNCQNHTISQTTPLKTRNEYLPPAEVVRRAIDTGCRSIAYTYSEPIVWYEYVYDTAKLAREAGLKNLFITAGYINAGPLKELAQYMDAANVDLKGFDDETYMKLNGGRLRAVLDTLQNAKRDGIFVEVTCLIVPEWTDNPDMISRMCRWIADTLGPDTPVHFSRFHPMYKLTHLPPTPAGALHAAGKSARASRLRYVYVGNVAGVDSNTYCPSCGAIVVGRAGYRITGYAIENGGCRQCGTPIAGIWE